MLAALFHRRIDCPEYTPCDLSKFSGVKASKFRVSKELLHHAADALHTHV